MSIKNNSINDKTQDNLNEVVEAFSVLIKAISPYYNELKNADELTIVTLQEIKKHNEEQIKRFDEFSERITRLEDSAKSIRELINEKQIKRLDELSKRLTILEETVKSIEELIKERFPPIKMLDIQKDASVSSAVTSSVVNDLNKPISSIHNNKEDLIKVWEKSKELFIEQTYKPLKDMIDYIYKLPKRNETPFSILNDGRVHFTNEYYAFKNKEYLVQKRRVSSFDENIPKEITKLLINDIIELTKKFLMFIRNPFELIEINHEKSKEINTIVNDLKPKLERLEQGFNDYFRFALEREFIPVHIGDKFNPNFHEPLPAKKQVTGFGQDTIVEVIDYGFRTIDEDRKTVKFAKVIVSE